MSSHGPGQPPGKPLEAFYILLSLAHLLRYHHLLVIRSCLQGLFQKDRRDHAHDREGHAPAVGEEGEAEPQYLYMIDICIIS